MEECEVGYEKRYSFDSSEEVFIKSANNNLYCDDCMIEQRLLD
ncbi:hypothetical protein [Bacillus thuringiensis]|nr:hypothetical protein [Bacillus thuringiensis]WIG15777.1 hypothetical protein QOM09_29980 [Bacillus thuringiensis]